MARCIRALALVLCVFGVWLFGWNQRATAANPASVTGQGRKGDWTFGGNVHVKPEGDIAGQFQIVRRVARFRPTVCHYDAFSRMTILVNKATFDAEGVCKGENEFGPFEFAASNRITVVDNGEPGARVDKIDVNFLGAGGIAIPGGVIDAGNLQVRTQPVPTAAELQLIALRRLQAASRNAAALRFEHGFPRGVIAQVPVEGGDPVARAVSFLQAYKDLYRQNSPDFGLGVRRVLAGRGAPGEAVSFYQAYKGLPVYGGEIVVFLKGDMIYGSVGALLTRIPVDTTSAFTAQQVELMVVGESRNAHVLGQTTLMIFDPSLIFDASLISDPSLVRVPTPRAAWRVTLGGFQPQRLFIDAQTGELLHQVFLTRSDLEIDLQSAENEASAETDNCFWDSDDVGVGNELGIYNSDFNGDQDAINALNFFTSTYNFYKNTFKRDSYDNDGNEFEVFIHARTVDAAGNLAPNAAYATCDVLAGTEEVFEFSDMFVRQDVVTHEATHGVVDYGSDLNSGNLPGALNESFADVFAALHDGNWIVGEGLPTGAIRSLSSPPDFGDPDRWSERRMGTFDNGFVHANAGIPNKAAFLLTEGDTHPDTNVTVAGIGTARMGYLYYWILLTLPSNADFFMARAALEILALMSGYEAWELCSIRNAFGAVEIGLPDNNCDGILDLANDPDNDSVVGDADNCPKVANPGQEDLDGDGLGDVCDGDDDGDGVPEKTWNNPFGDNCPGVYNPDQADANFNQIGTACDPEEDGDIDNDGVLDKNDNCPLDYNPRVATSPDQRPFQPDVDNDGEGDACDPDEDNDGISNDQDNCLGVPNPDQLNTDGDGQGNACDLCPFVPDLITGMGYHENVLTGEVTFFSLYPDADKDGTPDACDFDFNLTAARILFDGLSVIPSEGPRPDGATRQVQVSGRPRSYVSIPIPVCVEDCAVAPAPDQCVSVEFTGLSEEVHAFVTDDGGLGAGKAPKTGDRRELRLQPRGGRFYYLNFVFSPRFFAEETEFTMVERPCEVGDRDPEFRLEPLLPPPPLLPPVGRR